MTGTVDAAACSPTSTTSSGDSTPTTICSTSAPRRRSTWRSTLGRPLLLEGEPGVGKTTAAKTLAAVLDAPLLRLQCYEGLTATEALYDWNYQRQLLSIRLAEARGAGIDESDLYTEAYLVDRPILQCVRYRGPGTPVLLIDEIDRADDEFEALLLEFLGEAAVTVPELGTFVADRPADRGAHLQPQPRPARRAAQALPVPLDRLPGPGARGRDRAPHRARRERRRSSSTPPSSSAGTSGLDLDKPPGVAETIDWVAALVALGVADLCRRHRTGAGQPRCAGQDP